MEVRCAVGIARHLAYSIAVRQKTFLPLSNAVTNLSLQLKNCERTMLQPHCFNSTSAFCGLKTQRRRTSVLQSRTDASCHEPDILSDCMGSVRGMAGHSKWANIRHIKAAKDHEKSRVIHEYTRKLRAFIRESGQTDPKTSSQLARLIAEAKSKDVPNANIDRILTQMSSLKSSAPVMLTAKGPSGSVMMMEVLTSKISQTKSELQSIVKKCGFTMFDSGSLAKMSFEEKGVVQVSCPQDTTLSQEGFVDIAIEAGAEDVILDKDEEGNKVLQFICEPGEVYVVKKALEGRQLVVNSAEVVYTAINTVTLESSMLDLLSKALEKLDEHPDVLRVYINVQEAS